MNTPSIVVACSRNPLARGNGGGGDESPQVKPMSLHNPQVGVASPGKCAEYFACSSQG